MNTVSVYSTEGWIEDLPDLLLGRSSHGCGHYINDDNRMVIFHTRKYLCLREDIQKKSADLVKTALLGGRGSEKLLNFHHLQMMKNMEGGGSQSNISLLHRTQL